MCSSVYIHYYSKNSRIVQNVDSTSTLYKVSLIEFCTHAFIACNSSAGNRTIPSLALPCHLCMPLNVIIQIQKRKRIFHRVPEINHVTRLTVTNVISAFFIHFIFLFHFYHFKKHKELHCK